jgi:hypothetical protein
MRARGYAALLTASAITLIAPPSHAQRAGDGFLFHVPIGTWGVRGGINLASANSDVFVFVTDQLTLDRSDFNAPALGSNLAIRLSGSTDLVLDVSYSTVSHGSEFRHWVDQNDQPIEQTTSLRRIPVTLGVRHYVTSRGRSVGQFAWIPARRSLYVGLGAGMMEYKFHQVGDFIDFKTLNVFHDEFTSQDWTAVAQANAGLDLALGDFVLLNTEARYSWAKALMSSDYVGFNRIDLSGLSVTAGFSFRLY